MSGSVTIGALKRETWLPDRDANENGTLIAGQEYYNVYFSGGEISGVTISGLASPLVIADGGTGQDNRNDALNALLPSQASANTKVLKSDGTDASWQTDSTGGTVTSFNAGNLSPLFTTNVATATTTPALTFALTNATAKSIFGNNTSGAASPDFQTSPVVSGSLTANTLVSVVTTGTAPLTVASTTQVANLNVARSGLADTITVADAGGDTTTWPMLATSQTGNLAPATDGGLTFNATTNALTATTFIGALTGNADTASAAPAGTLTGTTLAANVVTSSLTSIGTIGTGVWQGTEVAGGFGGTGISSYAVGDILYASASTTLSKLADVAAGSYLRSGGVTTAPLWSTTTLPNSATTGDILQASASNVYSNLNSVATGNALISGGVATANSWGKIGLTTHVTGNLPVTNLNSGTSASSSTYWRGDGAWTAVNLASGVTGTLPNANAFNTSMGFIVAANFNSANTDRAITISLPTGYSVYRFSSLIVYNSGTTASLTTATAGVFSGAGGTGTTIVTTAALSSLTSNAVNTSGNMIAMTLAVGTTTGYNFSTVYFRVATAQGAAASGTVELVVIPIV